MIDEEEDFTEYEEEEYEEEDYEEEEEEGSLSSSEPPTTFIFSSHAINTNTDQIDGFDVGDIVLLKENPTFGNNVGNDLAQERYATLPNPSGYVIGSNKNDNELFIELHDGTKLRVHHNSVEKIEFNHDINPEPISYEEISKFYRFISYVVFKEDDQIAKSIKDKLDIFVPIILEET